MSAESPTVVIFNPKAGRGYARSHVEQARSWAAPTADLWPTAGPGHGVELARTAVAQGYRRVIAAGGDGTVHEVANGLLQTTDAAVRFGTWPLGSSNDFAFSLGIDRWFAGRGAMPLQPRPIDVGSVTSGSRQQFYVNCLGVGFNGMVTIEARRIRWLRGLPLYALAFIRAMLWRFRTPELTVTLEDTTVTRPTLSLTVNLGKREGGFPLALGAKQDDGLFDYLHVADVKRWELLRYLPALILGRLPTNHPKIRTGTCCRVSVTGAWPLCVHLDGEFFCLPEDGVTGIEVELLPRRLLVEAPPAG